MTTPRRAACPERRAQIPFVVAVSAVGQVVLDHASVRSVAYRLAPVSSVAPIRARLARHAHPHRFKRARWARQSS